MSSPLTPKQQREASLAAKRAEFAKKQAAEKRNRFLVIGSVIVAALAIVAVVITVVVTGATKSPTAGPTPGAGVQTWTGLASTHVQGPVKYDMDPPVGGPHDPVWLNCGAYTEPQRNENAVHALEHGAVWVTYDPKTVTDAQLAAIKKVLPDSYELLSPYPGLTSPFAISAWGAQLRFDDPSDPAVADFIATYWRSPTGPEPTAPCTGGIDGPGKVS